VYDSHEEPHSGFTAEEAPAYERGAVSPDVSVDDHQVEGALRPRVLSEFVGQERVREQLSLVLHSAQRRNRAPDHILMSGGPGLGRPPWP
jgi:Holliday junction DNA helicase RuvB